MRRILEEHLNIKALSVSRCEDYRNARDVIILHHRGVLLMMDIVEIRRGMLENTECECLSVALRKKASLSNKNMPCCSELSNY